MALPGSFAGENVLDSNPGRSVLSRKEFSVHITRPVVLVVALASLLLPGQALAKKHKKGKKKAAKTVKLMDEPRQVAEAYLKALAGTGDEDAREFLLGGVTFTAEEASVPNWEITEREKARKETKFLAPAIKHMNDLDRAGAKALNSLLKLGGGAEMTAITKAQADKILSPTKKSSRSFEKSFPVFAYAARVGKDVYFHPHNPWRTVIDGIEHDGEYTLELHLFRVREKSKASERVWPLRVLRFQAGEFDTGWKILPASDWDPDF